MTAENLLMANWKMWGNLEEWQNLLSELKNAQFACSVAIAPPMSALSWASGAFEGGEIDLASQNVSRFDDKGHTGETSAQMLKSFGCLYGIVGHSERRLFEGESSEIVAEKVKQLQNEDVIPVVCIGETVEQKLAGNTLKVLDDQLTSALKDASSNVVVAYEPVWAISNLAGENAPKLDEKDIKEAVNYISNRLKELFPTAENGIKILYGGSVNEHNAAQLIDIQNVDGFLVGSASLKSHIFVEIANQMG